MGRIRKPVKSYKSPRSSTPRARPATICPPSELFAPGPDPDMLAEVSAKLRKAAGLPTKPTGLVANDSKSDGVVKKVKKAVK